MPSRGLHLSHRLSVSIEKKGRNLPPLLGTRVNGLSRTLSVDGQGLPTPLNKQRRLMEQPTGTDRMPYA